MEHYGFVRVALAVPKIHLGNIKANFNEHVELIKKAATQKAQIIGFPELSLTGYSLGDLFHQELLLNKVIEYLIELRDVSKIYPNLVIIIGFPYEENGVLYNCAGVFNQGEMIAIIPKSYLPSYDEFKETIYFQPGPFEPRKIHIKNLSDEILFGKNIILEDKNNDQLKLGIEICEDLWSPLPPSTKLALNGATIIFNLSASNEVAGKIDYRRNLVRDHSSRIKAVYCYTSSGLGETSMDVIFGGQTLVTENGEILEELPPFSQKEELLIHDVDLSNILLNRLRNTVWGENVRTESSSKIMRVLITTEAINYEKIKLKRFTQANPFLNGQNKITIFQEIFDIQTHALAMRMQRAKVEKLVIGVSGGVDSTLALLVAIQALKILKRPLDCILPVTLPGFATSDKTYNLVNELITSLKLNLLEIDIKDVLNLHYKNLDHSSQEDITFENAQARYRYQILFDLANKYHGLVIGTGDLSELALGWMTFSGDHMSHYSVNSSIPKTIVIQMIKWYGKNQTNNKSLTRVLNSITELPISPELVNTTRGEISQKTEDILGPFELHDFFLYHMIISRFSPRKIFYLANHAFSKKYNREFILNTLKTFYNRFFNSQFKRSAMPEGIKALPVALTPRSQWRMPSDAQLQLWIDELNSF
jgi:NAD+ synthase (glutamine-hydrolysing)